MPDGEDGLLLLDGDGHTFINYLELASDLSEGSDYEWTDLIERHGQQVQARLGAANSDRVRAKLVWVARYHNFFCRLNDLSEYAVDGLTEAELEVPRPFRTITEVFVSGAR